MKNRSFVKYYLFACVGFLIASFYPLLMGIRVVSDMINNGSVMKENYPKYIIPYTPISVAIIFGVVLLPVFLRVFKKYAFNVGGLLSTALFLALEFLLENSVVVSSAEDVVVKLEDWQMYMCYYVPAERTVTVYRTQTAVDILMGDYNPAFKFHFYIISLILILSILNCVYGFAQIIKSGDKKRLKALILQSVSSSSFLALCILACFTAFWRDGSIQVSVLTAVLMTAFFMLFGFTSGMLIGSFFIEKKKCISLLIPSLISSLMVLLMYVGEMILLNGHLYSFGNGLLFTSIPGIILSAVDIIIIIMTGCITGFVLKRVYKMK